MENSLLIEEGHTTLYQSHLKVSRCLLDKIDSYIDSLLKTFPIMKNSLSVSLTLETPSKHAKQISVTENFTAPIITYFSLLKRKDLIKRMNVKLLL